MSARAASRALLLAAALAAAGCSLWPFGREPEGPAPDPAYGVVEVDSEAITGFYARAESFYGRIAQRRFNTLSTYRDEVLREFFRTEAAFADYYADLAADMAEASFERNRPLVLEVVEMRLSAPGEAEVVTRIVGEDGRPLRPGKTALERVDRWERVGGRWWIVPAQL
jgi:hypothetical protein